MRPFSFSKSNEPNFLRRIYLYYLKLRLLINMAAEINMTLFVMLTTRKWVIRRKWTIFTSNELCGSLKKDLFKGWFTRLLVKANAKPIRKWRDCQFSLHSWGHKSFLWGYWYPRFRLMTSVVHFRSRCIVCHLHAMDTSDSSLVQHLLASWQLAW